MTVETGTYISDLQPTNPTSTDPVNQGDDHIRLIKTLLQNTFPNASKANYFPSTAAGAAGTIAAASQNGILYFDTSGGNIGVTLPTLASALAGWAVALMKTSLDANAVTVTPPSGSILTQWGGVATVRVGAVCSSARFIWTGTNWICSKDGPLIGSTTTFDGPTVPAGYLTQDGSTFSGTTFAELAAALGSTTLFDKRGRVEYGVDSGQVNLNGTNGWGGVAPTLGTTHAGGGYIQLVTANVPSYTPSGSVSTSMSITDNFGAGQTQAFIVGNGLSVGYGGTNRGGQAVGLISALGYSATSSFSGNNNGGSSSPFPVTGPGIVTQKIIRAC